MKEWKIGDKILCSKAEDSNEATVNNPGIILEINKEALLPYLVGFSNGHLNFHSDGGSKYINKSWWCSGKSFKAQNDKETNLVLDKIQYLWEKQNYISKHV